MCLVLCGCTAPMPAADVVDAASDGAELVDVVENDVPEFDASVSDVPDPPVDVPNGIDVPNRDVPNRDVPNARDVPNFDSPDPPPDVCMYDVTSDPDRYCRPDPFNCGGCGIRCSGATPVCRFAGAFQCQADCRGEGRCLVWAQLGVTMCDGNNNQCGECHISNDFRGDANNCGGVGIRCIDRLGGTVPYCQQRDDHQCQFACDFPCRPGSAMCASPGGGTLCCRNGCAPCGVGCAD